MSDSQLTGTASSYARKYALNGLFCIDDTKDADTYEYQKQTTSRANKPSQKQTEVETIPPWIVQDDTFTRFECSGCHTKNHHTRWDYCPNCGAKMENAHG